MFERVIGTMRGRRSDELDFLLRRVEQAFTQKIKFENRMIIRQMFQVKDLLLTRYNVKVKLKNYR